MASLPSGNLIAGKVFTVQYANKQQPPFSDLPEALRYQAGLKASNAPAPPPVPVDIYQPRPVSNHQPQPVAC